MIELKVSAGQYLVRDPNFSGEGLHFTLNGDNSICVLLQLGILLF